MTRKKRIPPFPDEADYIPIREKLSDPNFEGGTQGLPENPTEVERTKYDLCTLILAYKQDHKLLQKDIAAKLGIDEPRVSDIFHRRIKGFTLDRLLGYAEILYPQLKLKIMGI